MDWGHRLKIHGLDLSITPSVEILQFYRAKIQAIGYPN
jgi:hypothetical protein